MLKITLFLCIFATLHSKEISPVFKYKSVGFVNDFIVVKDKLYVANDAGVIDIFNLKTRKIQQQIPLELVISNTGELRSANILSIDYLDGKILAVSIGKNAYRNVWIYENHQLKKIIDESAKLSIKEARFLDKDKILLATFASEILLYDNSEKYIKYKSHITQSTLGDIVLSKDKKRVLMADESGEVRVLDTNTFQTLQVYDSQNVDNIFHIAHANGVTITAGQDRRVGVYQKGKSDYHIKSTFLVYCVGITPSGKVGIYSSSEDSILQLFNTNTKRKMDTLVGHTSTVNQIKFINETELFSSEASPYIYRWKLDKLPLKAF